MSKAPRATVSLEQLKLWAALEGKVFPSAASLSKTLGVSRTRAWRILAQVKKSGAVRVIGQLAHPPDACHCVIYLRAELTQPRALEAVERRLEADPHVESAARLTGTYDYRLTSVHRDLREASDWFHDLLNDPAVAGGELQVANTLIDRPHYAAAILGSEHVDPQT